MSDGQGVGVVLAEHSQAGLKQFAETCLGFRPSSLARHCSAKVVAGHQGVRIVIPVKVASGCQQLAECGLRLGTPSLLGHHPSKLGIGRQRVGVIGTEHPPSRIQDLAEGGLGLGPASQVSRLVGELMAKRQRNRMILSQLLGVTQSDSRQLGRRRYPSAPSIGRHDAQAGSQETHEMFRVEVCGAGVEQGVQVRRQLSKSRPVIGPLTVERLGRAGQEPDRRLSNESRLEIRWGGIQQVGTIGVRDHTVYDDRRPACDGIDEPDARQPSERLLHPKIRMA